MTRPLSLLSAALAALTLHFYLEVKSVRADIETMDGQYRAFLARRDPHSGKPLSSLIRPSSLALFRSNPVIACAAMESTPNGNR